MEKVVNFIYSQCENVHHLKKFSRIAALPEESSLIFYTVWLKICRELITANCVKQKDVFQ